MANRSGLESCSGGTASQRDAELAPRSDRDRSTSGPDVKAMDALLSNARVIAEATSRISGLVGRLKVFAGIDQSRYTRVDLVQSIEDTIALLKSDFEQRVTVSIERESVPFIFGYATELHQLFLNCCVTLCRRSMGQAP
jgi:nitrogen-specific signal transduction histidine kinase